MALVNHEKSERTPEQQVGIRNTLILLCGIIALMLGLFVSTVLSPKVLSENELKVLGYFGFADARDIDDFQLLNHQGESVSVAQLKGQWSLVFFGFSYCPDICPTTMAVLNRAVEKMTIKPQVIMVSVDPERDTPAVLEKYVPVFNPDFVGYTGEFEQIVALATRLNVAFGKVPGKEPGTYTVDHSASIVVINPNGQYQGFIKSPHQANNIRQIMDTLMR